jgi:Fe-S-cluster containining protein
VRGRLPYQGGATIDPGAFWRDFAVSSTDDFLALIESHGDCADPTDCELCYIRRALPTFEAEAAGHCRCGRCCRELIIEVSALDALREPRIAAEGSPVLDWDSCGETSGEVIGYILNRRATPDDPEPRCVFLRDGNRCDIYDTRPTLCRAYDCRDFDDSTEVTYEIEIEDEADDRPGPAGADAP